MLVSGSEPAPPPCSKGARGGPASVLNPSVLLSYFDPQSCTITEHVGGLQLMAFCQSTAGQCVPVPPEHRRRGIIRCCGTIPLSKPAKRTPTLQPCGMLCNEKVPGNGQCRTLGTAPATNGSTPRKGYHFGRTVFRDNVLNRIAPKADYSLFAQNIQNFTGLSHKTFAAALRSALSASKSPVCICWGYTDPIRGS